MSEGPTLTCNECHGDGWHHLTCSAVRAALAIGVSAEERREQRHHDVLCLVLKELLASKVMPVMGAHTAIIALARDYADLAYPPPKAECDHEWSGLMASFGHSRRCAKCNRVELTPPQSTTDELRAAGFAPHGRDPLTGAPLPPKAEEP